jgi:hypothetical protein
MSLTDAELRNLFHYDPETGSFTRLKSVHPRDRRRYPCKAGCVNTSGYVVIRINDTLYYGHRLAWLYMHGEWPPHSVDHVNGDRADNRLANLRLATQSENGANGARRKNNTSGYPGVVWLRNEGKWGAQVMYKRSLLRLGLFETKEDALAVRNAKALELWGKFARTY